MAESSSLLLMNQQSAKLFSSSITPPRLWLCGLFVVVIILIGVVSYELRPASPATAITLYASARIVNGTIDGFANFSQSSSGGAVRVEIFLRGVPVLAPGWSGSPFVHGFHIHSSSDLSNNCANAGPHLNVDGKTHGGPNNATRHTGDLGNVIAGANGDISASFSDAIISLRPADKTYVVGKPVMLHADQDDLGLAGFPDSATTGHAGARIACAVIMSVK